MSMLTLEKPYIQRIGEKSRLCCNVLLEGNASEIWYEAEREYEPYLCAERCDAFVAAMFPYAMSHGMDLVVDGPVSAKLAYQLDHFLIPALAKYTREFHMIKTRYASYSSENFGGTGVGVGVSGGVDSFYTILKNLNQENKEFNVTHLTFFNVGSHGDFGGEEAREIFRERAAAAKQLSDELGLPFVAVDSNVSDILQMNFEATCAYRSLSAVLALQKLFGCYHFASGESIDMFHIDGIEASYHDLLNVQCFSTEGTRIYSSGITENRFEKIGYIKDNPVVQKHLNVCISDSKNCGHCDKCIRTMNALYALGVLDSFGAAFDVEDYLSNLDERLGYMLEMKDGREYVNVNHREAYAYMMENNIEIPDGAYAYAKKKANEKRKRRFKNGIKARLRKLGWKG